MDEKIILLSLFLLQLAWHYCEAKMEGKIIGGSNANIEQFPHAVYLSIACQDLFVCGGSVLNQRIVLTAAHCVFKCGYEGRVEAFAGHSVITEMKIKRFVSSMRVHENYNEDIVINDIALLRLSRRLYFGRNLKRVIITYSFPKVTRGSVVGWGLISDKIEVLARSLKWITQKIQKHSACTVMGDLHPGQFCAGSFKRGAARPAQGDSGGALVVYPKNIHQIGVISWTLSSHPGITIYTNVTYYYDWIRRNTDYLLCM